MQPSRSYQKYLIAAGVVLCGLSSTLRAATLGSTLDVDDNSSIYDYQLSLTPQASPLSSATFSGSASSVASGMAFTNTDQLIVTDQSTGTVNIYSGQGPNATESALISGLTNPTGLSVDGAGNIYVETTVSGAQQIDEFDPTGETVLHTFSSSGMRVDSLVVDNQGDVFVADNSGKILEFPAGGGVPATYANLLTSTNDYGGITFDGSGDLFVTYLSTSLNQSAQGGGIIEITPSGVVSSFYSMIGNVSLGTALFPTDVAYDGQAGVLYMAYKTSSNGNSGGIDDFLLNSQTPSLANSVATNLMRPTELAVLTPEPGSVFLFATGLAGLMLLFRRRAMKLARR